jgi:hypothetical protein
LDFSTNFNLHLVRVVRNDKVDEVLCSRFELKLAFKEIAYAFHYDFDERHTILNSLRNDDSGIYVVVILVGIYGVTLRQQYKSDRYYDDGYLFLLWDFRNKSMPLIHVRTWQPASTVGGSGDIINIQDFNLQ